MLCCCHVLLSQQQQKDQQMKPETKKKAKQVGFIAMIALASVTMVNTLAKRNATAAKLRDKMANGL
jgi:hypothetical protein